MWNELFLVAILSSSLLYFFGGIDSLNKTNTIDRKKILSLALYFLVYLFFLSFLYLICFFLRQKIESLKGIGIYNILKLNIGINFLIFMKMENLKLKINLFRDNSFVGKNNKIYEMIYNFSSLIFDILFLWLNFSTIFFYNLVIHKSFYNLSIFPIIIMVFIISIYLYKLNSFFKLKNEKILKMCFFLNALLNAVSVFRIV